MLKAKRCVGQGKAEGTYSVDPTLTAADNSIIMRNVRLRTMQQALDERRISRPWFGGAGKAIAKTARMLSFDCELAGSGVAGTAPGWGPFMKACGASETIVPATSVTYAPVSTGESSVYIKWFMDGKMFALPGSRGSCSLRLQAGKIPLLSFNFIGLYLIPADVAIPAPTFVSATPLAVNKVNTPTTALHGTAVKLSSLELDLGKQVLHNNKPQIEEVHILDHQAGGRISFEEELVAVKDWYTIVRAGTTGALSVIHGTAAGNIATLSAARLQLEGVDQAEEEMVSIENMPFNLQPGASGNDDWSIALT